MCVPTPSPALHLMRRLHSWADESAMVCIDRVLCLLWTGYYVDSAELRPGVAYMLSPGSVLDFGAAESVYRLLLPVACTVSDPLMPNTIYAP